MKIVIRGVIDYNKHESERIVLDVNKSLTLFVIKKIAKVANNNFIV